METSQESYFGIVPDFTKCVISLQIVQAALFRMDMVSSAWQEMLDCKATVLNCSVDAVLYQKAFQAVRKGHSHLPTFNIGILQRKHYKKIQLLPFLNFLQVSMGPGSL